MTPDPTISPREEEILAAVGERLTNAEIAARFHIGVRTVESHVSALLRKLGAADRRALAALQQASRGSADRYTEPPYLNVTVFGRESDVIGIGQLLTESRLVTLSGPGGVGKSTLALVVAGNVSIAPDHARAYVDLAPVGSAGDVGPTFASALGVDRDEKVPWTERLAEAMGSRQLLVVVDNADRVVDATADLVNELLRRASSVRFLVTSREPLSIPSERAWEVSPLAVTPEQAIGLFCDRAAAVRPGWTASDEDLRTVGVICERLDGLPLAIELAAAEVRARSVDDIARRLDEPLTLLEHGDRTQRRHRTLRAVMDSSYDLLNADERAVLDRLGAFVAGFSITDAQRLCADLLDENETERIVVALVARSLLRVRPQQTSSRYDMLDTIRHYALDHLDASGTLAIARDRHASTMTNTVTDAVGGLWGPSEAHSVAWFEAAHADVVEAYRWLKDRGDVAGLLQLAVHCYLFGWSHGRPILRELVGDAISTAERAQSTVSPDLLALAYGAAAAAATTAGDLEASHRLLEIGFDHASGGGEGSSRLCHGAAADLALFAGDTNAGSEHYRLAADGFRTAGLEAMAAYLDAASGLALTYGRRQAEARPILERSLAAADVTGCPSARAFARYTIAEMLAAEDPAVAGQRLEEAIQLAQSVSATFIAGVAELSLATLDAATGRPRAALARYPTMIEIWRRSGNWTQQWNTLRTLVFVFADLERNRSAAELMAAIMANGAGPTWGHDAAAWVTVREKINSQLEPATVEGGEAAARHLTRGDVLALAEALVRAEQSADRVVADVADADEPPS